MKSRLVLFAFTFLFVGMMTSCNPEAIEETEIDQVELFANDDPTSDEAEEDIDPNE